MAPSWTSLFIPAGALPAGFDRVVLFDGVCTLCDGTVNFLIARDVNRSLRFCALQSAAAQPVLTACGLKPNSDDSLGSILFVELAAGGEEAPPPPGGPSTAPSPRYVVYRKSTAILKIAAHLPGPLWPAVASSALFCVPVLLRDAIYTCVATHRYRVFGKSEDCLRPTAAIRSRFLDAEELRAGPPPRAGRDKDA